MKSKKFDTFQLASGTNYIELPEELFYSKSEVRLTTLNLFAWGLETTNENALNAIIKTFNSAFEVKLKQNSCIGFKDEKDAKEFVKIINDLLKTKIKEII